MMRSRYAPWLLSDEIQASPSSSLLWEEICAQVSDVIFQTRWLLRDGRSVNLLLDPWIADLPLSQWLTFINSEVVDSMRICDLFHPNGKCWDPMAVAHLFREQLGEHVLSMVITIHRSQDAGVQRSSYTPRVAMADLHRWYWREPRRHLDVKWIWRIGVHSRMSLVLWKVAWGRLLIRSILKDRGMDLQLACPSRGLEVEIMEHILLQYSRSRQVQYLAGLHQLIIQVETTVQAFLELLRQSIGGNMTRVVGIRAIDIAYHIWLSRNSLVLESKMCPTRFILKRALILATKLIEVTSRPPKTWDSYPAYLVT